MNETQKQQAYYDTAALHMQHYGNRDEILIRAQEYMRHYKPYQTSGMKPKQDTGEAPTKT